MVAMEMTIAMVTATIISISVCPRCSSIARRRVVFQHHGVARIGGIDLAVAAGIRDAERDGDGRNPGAGGPGDGMVGSDLRAAAVAGAHEGDAIAVLAAVAGDGAREGC